MAQYPLIVTHERARKLYGIIVINGEPVFPFGFYLIRPLMDNQIVGVARIDDGSIPATWEIANDPNGYFVLTIVR